MPEISGQVREKRTRSSRFPAARLRSSIFQGDKPASHGVTNQLRGVLQAEFSHQVCAMVLDRSLADMEPGRDLGARAPSGGELQDLPLSPGECLVRIKRGRPGLLDVNV